jgi:hypothetical protein
MQVHMSSHNVAVVFLIPAANRTSYWNAKLRACGENSTVSACYAFIAECELAQSIISVHVYTCIVQHQFRLHSLQQHWQCLLQDLQQQNDACTHVTTHSRVMEATATGGQTGEPAH